MIHELIEGPPSTLAAISRPFRPAISDKSGLLYWLGDVLPLQFKPPVTQSAIRDASKCKRLLMFRHRLALQVAHEYSAPLEIGSLFHELIAQGIQPPPDNAWTAKDAWLSNHLREMGGKIDAASKDGFMPDGTSVEDFRTACEVDAYKAAAMALALQDNALVAKFTVRAVEQRIRARVAFGPSICPPGRKTRSSQVVDIDGTLDLLLEEEATKQLWPWDHKTTGRNPVDMTDALGFDVQSHHYRLLAKARFPSKIIGGFGYNIAAKPTIKFCPKTKDKDGPESYFNRVKEWYAERHLLGQSDRKKLPVIRSRYRFTDPEPPADYFALLSNTDKLMKRRLWLKNFPRVCDNYTCLNIQGRPCPFLALCRSEDRHSWKELIGPSAHYRQGVPHGYEEKKPEPEPRSMDPKWEPEKE